MKTNRAWLAPFFVLLASCSNETTGICGSTGDEITVDGAGYCVYRHEVVVENGFECPPDRPNLTREGGIGVCAQGETIPGPTLERIGREYRELDPTYESCILDFECEAGEVCRQGVCSAQNVVVNNANNTSTNNTSTNSTSACQSSADCMAGELCENGECIGACGGFAGFTCDASEWCDYPADTFCGAADELGTCRPRPQACTDEVMPVCGCDGQDYSNECDANAAGTDAASAGMCP